jgi:hypothetical protein
LPPLGRRSGKLVEGVVIDACRICRVAGAPALRYNTAIEGETSLKRKRPQLALRPKSREETPKEGYQTGNKSAPSDRR